MLLSQAAIAEAVLALDQHEQGGNNRGPYPEYCLGMVHLCPGQPWCMAAAYVWFELASRKLGVPNPCPRTGSSLHVWDLANRACRDSNPSPGALYVLRHSPSTGHVGIIESVTADGITEISGNTNAAGSRDGNCVARKTGPTPELIHGGELIGYLQFDRA